MGNLVTRFWRSVFSSPVLTLNGYLAVNLPRTVTALGSALLTGVAVTHVYAAVTASPLPGYFGGYVVAVVLGCVAAIGVMAFGLKPRVPSAGWYLGSTVCAIVLVISLVSRVASLPDLDGLTGRWDCAPATLAMALAAGFIAVHTTVLSGITVAYPQRQHWHD